MLDLLTSISTTPLLSLPNLISRIHLECPTNPSLQIPRDHDIRTGMGPIVASGLCGDPSVYE